MSFASTPLGQGRRLDHHTFLKKASTNAAGAASTSTHIHATAASQRPHVSRQNLNNPASYSYGAPTAASRSPPKPERSNSQSNNTSHEHTSDSEQPALVRFARLKQLEQTQQQEQGQNHALRAVGPRIINTPPNPTKWQVKDTSVNIASAFHQAASSVIPAYDTSTSSQGSANQSASTSRSTIMNPNDSWASNTQRKPALPRSTSVEYEKETQAVNRRLANPPPRSNLSRPPSRITKVASIRHVPDSEGEEDTRGKSPFEQVVEMSKKLTQMAPTTFFLRRQSEEPEARPAPPAQDQSASYDYSAEEREFQASSLQDKSNSMEQRAAAVRKRNRMSIDNKAYKPTNSDMDDSDEEFEEDGKRTRRKKTKKAGAAGGLLTSLPVLGYDKRRKGRRGTKENGGDEDGSGEEQEQEQVEEVRVAEQRAARATTPLFPAPPVVRRSVPPPSRQSVPRSSVPPEPQHDSSGANGSGDIESGLHSIPEIDEGMIDSEMEADSSTEVLSQRSFSVGATLGRGVHWFVSLFYGLGRAMWAALIYLPLLILRTIALLFDNVVYKPAQRLARTSFAPLYRLIPWLVVGLGIYAAWSAANSGFLSGLIPSRPSIPPAYIPPATTPPADLSALSDRLLRLETALSSLSLDTARTRTYIEGDAREQALISGKLRDLEGRLARESSTVTGLETRIRASTSEELEAVKQEMGILRAQLDAQRRNEKQRGETASDKEARAQLKALEERVGSVEGGVKEAIELSKNTKQGPIAALPSWVKNLATGKTAVTIKASDGQDVSGLIDTLVESAVSRASRDRIGRADYAMYSSGASVIPSLTSTTYEVKPHGFTNKFLGIFTGQGTAVGRPPVTALNHENHNGHCWPFEGTQGQLGVLLAFPTRVTEVTIDHVAKEVATDMRSAPRRMEVWALVEGAENLEKLRAWQERREERRVQAELLDPSSLSLFDNDSDDLLEEDEYPKTLPPNAPFLRLASFTYNAHSSSDIQTFPVRPSVRALEMDFGIVVLVVKSNWGRDEYTCLYRFRVHGERVDGVPEILPEDAP